MKNILIMIVTLCSFSSIAAEVKDLGYEYKTVRVKANQVDGVKLYLTKEIERTDCNQTSIHANETFVEGRKSGDTPVNWNSTYYVGAYRISTELHCPLAVPVKETIQSKAIDIKSYTNQYIDRVVIINVVIPKTYNLVVKEY